MKEKDFAHMTGIARINLLDILKLLLGFNISLNSNRMNLWVIPEPYFSGDLHALQIIYRRYFNRNYGKAPEMLYRYRGE